MAKKGVTVQDARILVVEDDENNRVIARKLLELAGVSADRIFAVEGNPLPYMQAHLADGVDLILLDLQLPDKDGYAILAELKSTPDFAQIPVVAMTANVMKTDIERVQAAGFDGFIGKPINPHFFGEWIQRSLAGEKMWTAV